MAKKKIKRIFASITDGAMLSGADTMRDLFEDDQAQFLAWDASFDTAFKDDWDQKIDAARHFPTDDSINAEIAVTIEDLKKVWNDCKNHFQEAKFYITKAFATKAEQNLFGCEDYRQMSIKPLKVIPFMDLFHAAAEKHKTALIAQGYTQAKIDEIETLGGNFRTASRAKQRAKKDRFMQTEDRILTMNDVWKMLQKVNRAGKHIFKNDHAKLTQYLLPAKPTAQKHPIPAPSTQ